VLVIEAHGPCEQGECPGQVALAEGQQTNPVIGKYEAAGVIDRLGNLEPYIPEDPALSERAQLGMAPGESDPGEHSGQVELAKVLTAPWTLEGRHSLLETVDRLTIVALSFIGPTEV
jgi:hypothetical protein